jgi:transposase InsO family protein
MKFTQTSRELINVVTKLLKKEKPKVYHSDSGKEMNSIEFNHLLSLHGVKQSLSRKSRPRDDAVVESFFGQMKNEICLRELVKTKTEKQVIQIVMR